MKEISAQFEKVVRELGQQLGQKLAEMMAHSPEAAVQALEGVIAREFPPKLASAEEPASHTPLAPQQDLSQAKILPGLSGRRRRPGEPPPKCGKLDCTRPSRTRGYCQTHYVQWLKAGKP